MPVIYNAAEKTFHLQGKTFSYCLAVGKKGEIFNLYWGARLPESDLCYLLAGYHGGASFDPVEAYLPVEAPTRGRGYYGMPAVCALNAQGNDLTCLEYEGHVITAGKEKIPGLPATYVEAEAEATTLTINLRDHLTGLRVDLIYTVFEEADALSRRMTVVNEGEETLTLTHMLSASVPMYGCDFDLVHLKGAWARERSVVRTPLGQASVRVESQRGASGHEANPFIALCEKSTTEHRGSVWAMNLVYSGSFCAGVEVNNQNNVRMGIGLNSEVCRWRLESGEAFHTPEAVLVYSEQGFNGMSHIYHTLYRTRLCRGVWRDRERPILINNWEGTYFDFNEERILAIARRAKEIGVELFVLDDGWFGKRNTDNCSLGDWVVNREKLPCGIDGLAAQINDMGLMFGLWFEPEMVSPDSDLYRAHPDWCLHVAGRPRTEARQQLILDLSRTEVQDYIIRAVSDVLGSANIGYVKWDMNRNMMEYFSADRAPERQMETQHRYMLGLYRVLEEITSAFPAVLFESCSGGGGRFDAGMLHYMPQTWTSDDTDPVERLCIQYGTSFVYPPSSMGAHVSASPNHQTGRVTSIKMRGDVALGGNFGFELDLSRQTAEDIAEAKRMVADVKRLRAALQQGSFTRIESPFEGNFAAWQFTSADEQDIILCCYQRLSMPNQATHRVFLRGLCPEAAYTDIKSGAVYSGAALMRAGLPLPRPMNDFSSWVYEFKRSEK